mmetsp:Transcript_88369/g.245304  ORF Transcript_88369/g.245304 Transcript_88369/m.245304 type:complete len:211 (+) Transcript_88369:1065-1697(+)
MGPVCHQANPNPRAEAGRLSSCGIAAGPLASTAGSRALASGRSGGHNTRGRYWCQHRCWCSDAHGVSWHPAGATIGAAWGVLSRGLPVVRGPHSSVPGRRCARSYSSSLRTSGSYRCRVQLQRIPVGRHEGYHLVERGRSRPPGPAIADPSPCGQASEGKYCTAGGGATAHLLDGLLGTDLCALQATRLRLPLALHPPRRGGRPPLAPAV